MHKLKSLSNKKMSLSNPTNGNTNPATKFFQWSGSRGGVKYYDKEKRENIEVELPFNFIKLDSLSTVVGYSDSDDSGYWSNEVRSIKSEPLIVKTSNGIKKEGLWSDIGEGLKAQGAKFANSVYIAYYNENKELELCNVKFFGSSILQWIEFLKANKGIGVSLNGATPAKKGSNKYFTPVFETLEISDEDKAKAIELDKQLQVYLNSYFDYGNKYTEEGKAKSATANSSETESSIEPEDDEIPF